MNKKRDLVEIFGYQPIDTSKNARSLWQLGACPFINKACTKINHDQSITYGTCSVTSPYGDVIVCPNRLYANDYQIIKNASNDAFGDLPVLLFDEFISRRMEIDNCIVALGKNSGKEVQVGKSLSMDWVLAKISNGNLVEYTGIEVQSIDITGNYRDAWHFYKNFTDVKNFEERPSSQHGLNWANVHKRLIPQLIRKGVVYSRSNLVENGLYFIVPEIVYNKFEDIIGSDIPLTEKRGRETLTVMTYSLSDKLSIGEHRQINECRKIRFSLDDFANRFISGPNLPSGDDLDSAIMKNLGITL